MGRTIYRSLAANLSLTVGVFMGIKAADKLLWNKQKYELMKEEIELDYWKKFARTDGRLDALLLSCSEIR